MKKFIEQNTDFPILGQTLLWRYAKDSKYRKGATNWPKQICRFFAEKKAKVKFVKKTKLVIFKKYVEICESDPKNYSFSSKQF
jgi:hypothetical protein